MKKLMEGKLSKKGKNSKLKVKKSPIHKITQYSDTPYKRAHEIDNSGELELHSWRNRVSEVYKNQQENKLSQEYSILLDCFFEVF